jgi:uncharacterized protein (DUF1015 family)
MPLAAASSGTLIQTPNSTACNWVIRDSDQTRITAAFNAMPALYIADGHRSASASRIAAARRRQPGHTSEPTFFLSVIFPRTRCASWITTGSSMTSTV